jgi:cell division septation protein DedD
MEQKKILWIVVIVCVFLLIIFGAAIALYPSRSTGQNLKQASAMAITPAAKSDLSKDAAQSQSQIDPDSWVRQPGNTPGIDPHAKPNANGINLTIVNGDNAGANYGTLDVSHLTTPQQVNANGDQSQALPLSDIPGQTTKVVNQTSQADGTAANGTAPAKGASTTVITNSIVKGSGTASSTVHSSAIATAAKPAKAPADQKAASKEPAKKPATDTGFWIQTGSFSNKANAEKARETLGARYLNAEIFTKDTAGKTTYRVRVGPYKTKAEADYWLGTVKEIPGFSGSFVSEVKTKK